MNKDIAAAFELFEALEANADMWGCHYGLICEHGKYEAVCVVGESHNPLTKFHDYCEPQETPLAAARLALKNEFSDILTSIRDKRSEADQRRNLRQLRRAIRATLKLPKFQLKSP